MKFGKSAAEAEQEPNRGGGGGDFIRYFKDGDTTVRLLQEPDEWVYYWEHFTPDNVSFPCTNDEDTCPGCLSTNEKTKKVSRKIAFNVLHSFNGNDYVDVFKIPTVLEGKLKNRYGRLNTITDRDYTVTRYKTPAGKVDYDLEGNVPVKIDRTRYELKDIETMLKTSFDEVWGAGGQNEQAIAVASRLRVEAEQPEDPPSKPEAQQETVVSESDLRRMAYDDILQLCRKEVGVSPPDHATTTDLVVDWLLQTQS